MPWNTPPIDRRWIFTSFHGKWVIQGIKSLKSWRPDRDFSKKSRFLKKGRTTTQSQFVTPRTKCGLSFTSFNGKWVIQGVKSLKIASRPRFLKKGRMATQSRIVTPWTKCGLFLTSSMENGWFKVSNHLKFASRSKIASRPRFLMKGKTTTQSRFVIWLIEFTLDGPIPTLVSAVWTLQRLPVMGRQGWLRDAQHGPKFVLHVPSGRTVSVDANFDRDAYFKEENDCENGCENDLGWSRFISEQTFSKKKWLWKWFLVNWTFVNKLIVKMISPEVKALLNKMIVKVVFLEVKLFWWKWLWKRFVVPKKFSCDRYMRWVHF